MLSRLSSRSDSRLKLTFLGRDEEDGGVPLTGSRYHILNEVPVPRSIDDREEVLRRLELQEA